MEQLFNKNTRSFSTRKVSVDQAIRVLKRNGIQVNKEGAETILDFLYLIAKTYRVSASQSYLEGTNGERYSNTPNAF